MLVPEIHLVARADGHPLFDPFNGEVYVCSETTPGSYSTFFTVLDGLGGKTSFPVTIVIEEEQRAGAGTFWE
jgi:hypothetical protein